MTKFFGKFSLLQHIYICLLFILSVVLVLAFAELRKDYLVSTHNIEGNQGLRQVNQIVNPYTNTPVLANYARYRDAFNKKDIAGLKQIAYDTQGSYLEYQSALTLARMDNLPIVERVSYYQRVLELFTRDSLVKQDRYKLYAEFAQFAEQAGLTETAIAAYEEALPLDEAIIGLGRVQTDPYKLANTLQKANQNGAALRALGSLKAPSIDAPAYRALRENDKAMAAYNDWLAEVPNDPTALLGKAWIHFRFGEYDEADAIFARLSSADALSGRGLVAENKGDLQAASNFYRQANNYRYLWELAEVYEDKGQIQDALDVYMDLAKGSSGYTDDAAYRALVLANTQDNASLAQEARALIPAHSFFRLTLGEQFDLGLTVNRPIGQPTLPVITLADALTTAGNPAAAAGELAFALRTVSTEEELVLLGTKLNSLGDYMQSARVAQKFIDNGSKNLDVWRIAYPLAYPDLVFKQAQEKGLEPTLMWSVMRVESVYYPKALSWADARGLMQFIDSTWDWMAERMGETPGDPYVPEDNIRYGAEYLKYLLEYFDGDVELAVPAYNGGQGFIKRLYEGDVVNQNKPEYYRRIDKTETREYLQKVLVAKEIYRILYSNP